MNLIESAKQQIDSLIQSAYSAAAAKGELPAGAELRGIVEIPKDTANGDYAACTPRRAKLRKRSSRT